MLLIPNNTLNKEDIVEAINEILSKPPLCETDPKADLICKQEIVFQTIEKDALGTSHPEGQIIHIVLRKPIMNSYILCAATLQHELQRAIMDSVQDESEVFKSFNTKN